MISCESFNKYKNTITQNVKLALRMCSRNSDVRGNDRVEQKKTKTLLFYSLASVVACAASVVPVTIVVVVVNGVVDVVAVPPEAGPICKSTQQYPRYIRLADIVTISHNNDTDDDNDKQRNRPHQTKPKQKQ